MGHDGDSVKAFRRQKSMLVAEVDHVEERILAGVFADTALLLGTSLEEEIDGEPGLTSAERSVEDFFKDISQQDLGEPKDPALARLLPNAYEDEASQVEFRRLTEGDIRAAKVDRLRKWVRALQEPGEEVCVPEQEAGDWVAAMTDVRLVLATRLGIETPEDAQEIHTRTGPDGESSEEYTQFALSQIYSALTWLQESLLTALMRAT